MHVKRKKFKAEITPERRLAERWDQSVFFARRTYPGIEERIERLIAAHTEPSAEAAFTPSEQALRELEALCAEMKN